MVCVQGILSFLPYSRLCPRSGKLLGQLEQNELIRVIRNWQCTE